MPMMRRRPLLRAAAIGGGAYMAGKRTMATQETASAPVVAPEAPAPAAGPDIVGQLSKLAELRDQGVLTEAEFAEQKARILAA
jgi:hypothetical protein